MANFDNNINNINVEIIKNHVIKLNKKITNTTFGELRVANRTNLIDIKSIFGISNLRDQVYTSNGGYVDNDINVDSEYTIGTSNNTNSSAKLESRARGRYVAGIEAEVGIAIRLCINNLSGNGYYLWGYYDNNNGYGFRYDNTGLCVFIRKDGSDIYIHQDDFNVNSDLNNLDNNGVALDFLKGNIFNISITWYGYGDIIFIVNIKNTKYVLHRYSVINGTSNSNPNLPITAEANNNGSSDLLELCVAGRQYSHLGSYNPVFRLTPITVFNKSVPTTNAGSSNNYTPIFSFRRKNTFLVAPITIDSLDVISNQDCIISVFSDTTLDGNEVWEDIVDIGISETSLEYDTTASEFTTSGLLLMSTLISGGAGNKNFLTAPTIRGIDLSGDEIITVAGKSISSNATMDIVFTLREEF